MSEQTKTEQPMTDAKLAEIRARAEAESRSLLLKLNPMVPVLIAPGREDWVFNHRLSEDVTEFGWKEAEETPEIARLLVPLKEKFATLLSHLAAAQEQQAAQATELERVKGERDAAQQEAAMWRQCVPDRCPITGLPFFMPIGKEDGTWYATYGGPYDSYTIPKFFDNETHLPLHEREMHRERYDHDEGGWLEDECEIVGQRLIEDEAILEFEDKISTAEAALSASQSRVDRLFRWLKWFVGDDNVATALRRAKDRGCAEWQLEEIKRLWNTPTAAAQEGE